jgi:flagellar biosynthesis/type III secretory pathway protein FliH
MGSYFAKVPYLTKNSNFEVGFCDQLQELQSTLKRQLDISQQTSLYDSSKEIRELANEAATAVVKRSNQKDDSFWVKTLAADLAKLND